jgi:hypothetical protein
MGSCLKPLKRMPLKYILLNFVKGRSFSIFILNKNSEWLQTYTQEWLQMYTDSQAMDKLMEIAGEHIFALSLSVLKV